MRIEIRQGHERQNLACVDIHQHGRGPLGVHQLHAAVKHPLRGRLHGQINGQLQRRAAHCGVAQELVKKQLRPGDADDFRRANAFFAVGRAPKDVRGQPTIGIKPHFAGTEHEARIADIEDGLFLFGADFAFDPEEFAVACEVLYQPRAVEIREDRHQFVCDHHRVDHLWRLGVECVCFKVGRQNTALAVHNVRAHGRDRRTRSRGTRLMGF